MDCLSSYLNSAKTWPKVKPQSFKRISFLFLYLHIKGIKYTKYKLEEVFNRIKNFKNTKIEKYGISQLNEEILYLILRRIQ